MHGNPEPRVTSGDPAQPAVRSSARPCWMSSSVFRRAAVVSPVSPALTVYVSSWLFSIPIGVITAAVPQANISVI